MSKKGNYIVIEGLDGCGKTTQYQRLLDHLGPSTVGVREPGGTPMAEAIRELLKEKDLPRSAHANLFLLSAARSDLIDKVIRPSIQRGLTVVSDRNWLSTAAYQRAEGASLEDIESISRLATNEFFAPDTVLLIDTDPATCAQRLQNRGNIQADYFDTKTEVYFKRVRQAYLDMAQRLPYITIIDGSPPPDKVWQQIQKITTKLSKNR